MSGFKFIRIPHAYTWGHQNIQAPYTQEMQEMGPIEEEMEDDQGDDMDDGTDDDDGWELLSWRIRYFSKTFYFTVLFTICFLSGRLWQLQGQVPFSVV